jgi:8-oxo-dGTP pyrophosphatase MutT (NUDIX family)
MAHIHEKVDFTVEVFVVYKDKVLLRKHDKYKIWLSVGGHIELDEDPNQAAVREVREEVGLAVEIMGGASGIGSNNDYKELIPPKFLNRHRINDSHEHVTLVYFGTTKTDQTTQGQEEASDDMRWFTLQDLDDPNYNLRENVKYYARQALKEAATLA